MAELSTNLFNPDTFLATAGQGRKVVHIKTDQTFFVQGGDADSVFYIQRGRAKLTVVSTHGKEATLAMISTGDFTGEESLIKVGGVRRGTVTALAPCMILRIEREEMNRALHDEFTLSDLFVKFLVTRNMRTQEDLVNQLFNSSEKRLARTLLLMADSGSSSDAQTLIPPITQESLAGIVGTTRSRISFFMNRFRKLGLIEYNGRIHVHRVLLGRFLHDELPEGNTDPAKLLAIPSVPPTHPWHSLAPLPGMRKTESSLGVHHSQL